MTTTKEEFEEFVAWQDDEGGLAGLLYRSGPGVFPEEMRQLAEDAEIALSHLRIRFWTLGDQLGVRI